jgi:hypothetical protein
VALNCRGSIEEEELGFFQVESCTRGFTKVCEDGFELVGFLSSGSVH